LEFTEVGVDIRPSLGLQVLHAFTQFHASTHLKSLSAVLLMCCSCRRQSEACHQNI